MYIIKRLKFENLVVWNLSLWVEEVSLVYYRKNNPVLPNNLVLLFTLDLSQKAEKWYVTSQPWKLTVSSNKSSELTFSQ